MVLIHHIQQNKYRLYVRESMSGMAENLTDNAAEQGFREDLAEGLRRLRDMSDGPVSEDDFAGIIDDALALWQIPEEAFREEFALSHSAVLRWASGHNLPQPDVRPVIVEWLYKKLEEKAGPDL